MDRLPDLTSVLDHFITARYRPHSLSVSKGCGLGLPSCEDHGHRLLEISPVPMDTPGLHRPSSPFVVSLRREGTMLKLCAFSACAGNPSQTVCALCCPVGFLVSVAYLWL